MEVIIGSILHLVNLIEFYNLRVHFTRTHRLPKGNLKLIQEKLNLICLELLMCWDDIGYFF